jgi:hypothetical protein
MPQRPDDPQGVMRHAGKYAGGTALIVLGGYSAVDWEQVRDSVRPDVILGANGVNAKIHDLDYWMCAENMTRSAKLADEGDERSRQFAEILNRKGARVRLVSHRSWHLLEDASDAICIRRQGYELTEIPENFTIRNYGEGYWSGWILKHKHAGVPVHVGTVGLHMLHHAGILGCSEVHTIGFDLMFREGDGHHWYPYPIYQADRFRNETMFTTFEGIPTQHYWIETAEYLKAVEWLFNRDGMRWIDHSNGLLTAMGLECTRHALEFGE